MSERWVLVPVEPQPLGHQLAAGQWAQVPWTAPVRQCVDASITAGKVYAAMISARPPVSREWLEAAVERGARALCKIDWGFEQSTFPDGPGWRDYTKNARAAILAALEMTDADTA